MVERRRFAAMFVWYLGLAVSSVDATSSSPAVACGETVKFELEHDGLPRKYILHIPLSVCDAQLPSPIVFGLHCFGCPPDYYKDKLLRYAESGMFVLVIPWGWAQSWNAGACCGEARRRGLDDVGLMHRIVDEVQKQLGPLASDAVFVTGWSNGGYLSSLLGVTPHSAFKAVAPIAGYVYDGFDAASSPVPLFQHHGRNDPMVRYEGCCTGDSTGCCCGISDAGGERCVSAPESFRRWGHDVNHCADADPARSYTDVPGMDGQVECVSMSNCRADTTLCTYPGYGHFNGVRGFPEAMQTQIVAFFMQHACRLGGGIWSAQGTAALVGPDACECGGSAGGYCLSGTVKNVTTIRPAHPPHPARTAGHMHRGLRRPSHH